MKHNVLNVQMLQIEKIIRLYAMIVSRVLLGIQKILYVKVHFILNSLLNKINTFILIKECDLKCSTCR